MIKTYGYHTLILLVPVWIFIDGLPNLLPVLRVTGCLVCVSIGILTLLTRSKWMSRLLAAVAFSAGGMYLTFVISRFLVMNEGISFEVFLQQHEPMAFLLYFLICLLQPILLPIPEMVTVMGASAVIGPFNAFLIGFFGTITGIMIMFWMARTGGIKLVKRFIKETHLKRYHDYVQKNESWILILLFVIPVLPDEIICVGAGLSGVRFSRFFLIAASSKLFTSLILAYSVELVAFFSLSIEDLLLLASGGIVILTGLVWVAKRLMTKTSK